MKLQTTTDYSAFQLHSFNREVGKTKRLEDSMRKHGFIAAYPLHVVKDGKALIIKGGHHRFTVAASLGLPVHFVVCNDSSTIHELEKATSVWKVDDYLTSFCNQGLHDYLVVKEYQSLTGISPFQLVSMLGGEMASSNNKADAFKRGSYKVVGTLHVDTVWKIILAMDKAGATWGRNSLCVSSISRIITGGAADMPRMIRKISAHPYLLSKQANLAKYLDMWEEIYNRGAKGQKAPLVFMTNEAIKKRLLFPAW